MTDEQAREYMSSHADGLDALKSGKYDSYIFVNPNKSVQFYFVKKGGNVSTSDVFSDDEWVNVKNIIDIIK